MILLVTLCAVAGEETPPGLVTKDSEQDLQAEASQSGMTRMLLHTFVFILTHDRIIQN